MGCSPSHSGIIQSIAKNAAKPLKKNKAILAPGQGNEKLATPLSGSPSGEFCRGVNEQGTVPPEHLRQGYRLETSVPNIAKRHSLTEESNCAVDEAMVTLSYQRCALERKHMRKQSSTGSELDLGSEVQQESSLRRSRKTKSQRSNKQGRRVKAREKQVVFSDTEKKVDFPELLVKAHQNAYTYMNPNLSKYEAVIAMANQATQTQIILQQMVSFMAMRFDEINHCLGEIAEDGEKLLKDVGDNLTWPLGKGNPTEQPDLLQQLLQYTVNRMQTLNSAVSSLTSNALQEACSYLQSATTTFQGKLTAKQTSDERLMRTIKLLEDSAHGSIQPHANDSTLYSEDSGIGGDSESIKECKSPDKMERQTSQMSTHSRSSQHMGSQQHSVSSQAIMKTVAETPFNDKVVPQSAKPSQPPSLATSFSMNSLDSSTTLEQESNNDQDSEDCTSTEDSDNDVEDNKVGLDEISLPPRPMTSPAGAGVYRHSSKWLESPENEEMNLKMKEAISGKIKFVPETSSCDMWIREEGAIVTPVRPSTADGSNRRMSRHRRSRSAESLRSQSEDPTLLELQRTQKELNKKLEKLLTTSRNKSKEIPHKVLAKSFVHASDITPGNNACSNKLKSCLDKSFNILPSQESVSLMILDKGVNELEKNSASRTTIEKETIGATITALETKTDRTFSSPRRSVRTLIETFSPTDDAVKISNKKMLGPLRCVRKFGVPVLPPTIPTYGKVESMNHESSVLSMDGGDAGFTASTVKFPFALPKDIARTDSNEIGFDDFENLPPPPLEILMDDSYSKVQSNEHERDNPKVSLENVLPSTTTSCSFKKSQKLKSSLNLKDLLPSKNATDSYVSGGKIFRSQEEDVAQRRFPIDSDQRIPNICPESGIEMQRKHEIEQAANLYKQSHKIIPLQNPGEVETSSNGGENELQPLSSFKQNQCSPTSYRRSNKSLTAVRRVSPTKAAVSSPSAERKLANPPANKAMVKTHFNIQHSPPPVQRNVSSISTAKVPSPPTQKKLHSPPLQRKVQSPPQMRRQASPPRLPSPPGQQSPLSHRKTLGLSAQQPPSPQNLRKLPSPSAQKPPSPPYHRKLPGPTAQPPPSPPNHRKLPSPTAQQPPSPPNHRKLPSPTAQQPSPSPPNQRKLSSPSGQQPPSPPNQRKLPNPPNQRKLASPPTMQQLSTQRRLPNPPSQQGLSNPPNGAILSNPPGQQKPQIPPNKYREPSPPTHCTPSPPVSPSFQHKGLRCSSDDLLPSSKTFGNAQSIFCPSSSSLFETKVPSSPSNAGTEVVSTRGTVPLSRQSFSECPSGDQQRRMAMSAANPQPFIRRCYSDRRPRVQLRLPGSITSSPSCDSGLQHLGAEEPARRDSDPSVIHGITDLKAPSLASSQPELCVVGQGLQKE
uniref:Photoreceptor cilium actin regulator n=1 Tax=Leptobrachium leishanense TaxID=445787 RepID=A0A8C5MWH7_9ANUR